MDRILLRLRRQNPLVQSNPEHETAGSVVPKNDKKSPLNYDGVAANVKIRTEQRGQRPRQFHIIEFRLQRVKGMNPVQVHMAGYRLNGTIKEGDQVKGQATEAGSYI
jgi:hypothetical protein